MNLGGILGVWGVPGSLGEFADDPDERRVLVLEPLVVGPKIRESLGGRGRVRELPEIAPKSPQDCEDLEGIGWGIHLQLLLQLSRLQLQRSALLRVKGGSERGD